MAIAAWMDRNTLSTLGVKLLDHDGGKADVLDTGDFLSWENINTGKTETLEVTADTTWESLSERLDDLNGQGVKILSEGDQYYLCTRQMVPGTSPENPLYNVTVIQLTEGADERLVQYQNVTAFGKWQPSVAARFAPLNLEEISEPEILDPASCSSLANQEAINCLKSIQKYNEDSQFEHASRITKYLSYNSAVAVANSAQLEFVLAEEALLHSLWAVFSGINLTNEVVSLDGSTTQNLELGFADLSQARATLQKVNVPVNPQMQSASSKK